MAASIHFDIHTQDCDRHGGRYHAYIGARPTFDEAEKLARWHAARRGITVQVDKVTQTPRRRDVEQMATVSRDALGRLWTDLTWLGGLLV